MDTTSYLLRAIASGKSDPLVGVRSHEMWQVINRLIDELHARNRALNTPFRVQAETSYGNEGTPDTCPVCGADEDYNAYARCPRCHTLPHADEVNVQLEMVHAIMHDDMDQLMELAEAWTREVGEI